MERLENCPLCNAKAIEKCDANSLDWYIKCTGCGLKTITGDIKKVVEIWNKRTSNRTPADLAADLALLERYRAKGKPEELERVGDLIKLIGKEAAFRLMQEHREYRRAEARGMTEAMNMIRKYAEKGGEKE